MLHFSDNCTPNDDTRYWKLGNFLPILLEKFRMCVTPGKFISIDETLVGFKGRLSFLQYIPTKRSRFGIKLFVLVDHDTGFVLAVLPYEGKKTKLVDNATISRKNIGFGGTAAYTLLQPYLGLHHVVVMDSWFTSPTLAYCLLDKNTYLLGTVAKKRKNMPAMKKKLKKGDVNVFTDGKLMIEQ